MQANLAQLVESNYCLVSKIWWSTEARGSLRGAAPYENEENRNPDAPNKREGRECKFRLSLPFMHDTPKHLSFGHDYQF
jgi:hypothetical protein